MSTPRASRPPYACRRCVERSRLLERAGGVLDLVGRDPDRLSSLLSLDDAQLSAALGHRDAAAGPACVRTVSALETICCHDGRYPGSLHVAPAPRMLHVAGHALRFVELCSRPIVAIVGSSRASDYGMQVAASIARGLAFSGVSVAAPLGDGIGRAAHAGALEVEAESIAVSGAGLGTGCPPRLRRLSERVAARGCVVSELPAGAPARRWGVLGAARTLAALAQVTLVVEANGSPRALAAARVAQALGRRVAAVPGRVTSHTSAGPNQLLHEGAALVRGASDVLELLYAGDPAGPARCERRPVRLAPRLLATLRAVSSGRDTIQQLLGSGTMELEELLGRLSELELAGLLTRTSTGRYLPRAPD